MIGASYGDLLRREVPLCVAARFNAFRRNASYRNELSHAWLGNSPLRRASQRRAYRRIALPRFASIHQDYYDVTLGSTRRLLTPRRATSLRTATIFLGGAFQRSILRRALTHGFTPLCRTPQREAMYA